MKLVDQMTQLSTDEMYRINGGGLLDFLGGTGISGTAATPVAGGGSSADYTAYMAGMAATYGLMSAGHGAFMANNGTGMAIFLSNLRFPVQ